MAKGDKKGGMMMLMVMVMVMAKNYEIHLNSFHFDTPWLCCLVQGDLSNNGFEILHNDLLMS